MTIEAHRHQKLDGTTFAGSELRYINLEVVVLFPVLGLILTTVALLVSGSEINNVFELVAR